MSVMSDLISRQDALDALKEYEVVESDNFTKTDLITMMTVGTIANCIEAIVDLPSAEPERKKGEWIKVGHWGRSYKCNQCGNYLDFDGVNAGRGDVNFCPNCGADMKGLE